MKPAPKTGHNAHRGYDYVELSGIMEAARKPLADNGLAVVQTFVEDGEHPPILESRLLHESGQQISSRIRLLPTQDYHALGSACTYSKKYALAALLGIVAEGEDDDGEAAMPKAKAIRAPRKKAEPKKKPPADPHLDAIALIDKTDGARAMMEAKGIDPRELLPQVIEKIITMGEDGMKEKVKEWRKSEAKAEAEAAAEKEEKENSKGEEEEAA
tara:strand:+ start:283 stop:924 length:642 start_codon:yes stop_codon:yes gene_type:complete